MGDSALSLWGVGLTPAGSVKIELNPRTPAGVGKLENHWTMWKIHSYCPKCCEWRNSFASRVQIWAVQEFVSKSTRGREGVEAGRRELREACDTSVADLCSSTAETNTILETIILQLKINKFFLKRKKISKSTRN